MQNKENKMGLTDDIYKAFVTNMMDADSKNIQLTKFQKWHLSNAKSFCFVFCQGLP